MKSSDDEEEMNHNRPQIGDLNGIGEVSDTTSNNDIDMINDSESDQEVPRRMSEDEIVDALKYDVDGPTDIVDRQRFEEACRQARVMDREEKEEESPNKPGREDEDCCMNMCSNKSGREDEDSCMYICLKAVVV